MTETPKSRWSGQSNDFDKTPTQQNKRPMFQDLTPKFFKIIQNEKIMGLSSLDSLSTQSEFATSDECYQSESSESVDVLDVNTPTNHIEDFKSIEQSECNTLIDSEEFKTVALIDSEESKTELTFVENESSEYIEKRFEFKPLFWVSVFYFCFILFEFFVHLISRQQEILMQIQKQMQECEQKYIQNNCLTNEYPALVSFCNEWSTCKSKHPTVNIFVVLAESIAATIETLIGNLSFRTLVLFN